MRSAGKHKGEGVWTVTGNICTSNRMVTHNHQREAFKVLYDKYFKRIFIFIYKHTEDQEEAQDLTQEVFLKIWLNPDSFSQDIPPVAQLLTIARQLVINRYKKEVVREKAYKGWRVERSEVSYAGSCDNTLLEEELAQRFRAALDLLPPKRREIFEKSRIDGLSYDQIAEDLSVSRSTVESQMVKALKLMRSKLIFLLLCFLS